MAAVVLLAWRLPAGADDRPHAAPLLQDARSNFQSITADVAAQQKNLGTPVVELGRKLFFDPRISADGVWSCMLCHQPSLYGTDAHPKSRGVFDKFLPRNAPTVLNSALQFRQHWDGGRESVEEQAKLAPLGGGFGNANDAQAVDRLKAVPGYADLFEAAFPDDKDPVTTTNWAAAIGAYEHTLLTPSRFDDFLDGKTDALTPSEQAGLRKFIDIGCVNCHDGRGLGGDSFEKFGAVSDYWNATHSDPIDLGRFNITKADADRYVFKVPPLRNVEKTAPYFHDGSVEKLPDAARIMAKVQLGKDLAPRDVDDIVSFLNSLTGEIPANFAQAPVLPSGQFHEKP